jgi:hypothetical protein
MLNASNLIDVLVAPGAATRSMHRPWLWTVDWVDTNAADGAKGYQMICRERAGSVCKGAEFKTAGFTLNAPEVELADTGNDVRITILSKVAR